MIKIILVRHGETEWNRQEVFRGRLDIPLNKNGRRQAQAVAQALKKIPIDVVYTSPLRRARATARAIAQSQGLIIRSNRAFIDINFGQWQGKTHQAITQQYKQLYSQWHKQPHQVKFPNGESLKSVRQRAFPERGCPGRTASGSRSDTKAGYSIREKTLMDLCRQHNDENIVIVSHRVVNKVLLCAMLGLDNSHFWRIKQDTAAINICNCLGAEFNIELLNDTCHLRGLPRQTLDF